MNSNNGLPTDFEQALQRHFDKHVVSKVVAGLSAEPSTSIRQNPNKSRPVRTDSKAIPWQENGRLLKQRIQFALDPLFHAGAYYVQDASSMMLSEVLKQSDAPRDGVYLDLCAAPGGKSTIIMDHLESKGFLVANEIDPHRNAVLRENLLKWGQANHGITSLSSQSLASQNACFDVVLVDAPCSGEGMFRKDPFAREQWSQELIASCSRTQSDILKDVATLVKDEGVLIYSTCTMNPEENEHKIHDLLASEMFDLINLDMSAFSEWVVPGELNGKVMGYYLLPGISLGEGLFISALRKRSSSDPIEYSSYNQFSRVEAMAKEQFPAFFNHEYSIWKNKEIDHAVSNAELVPNLRYKRLGLPIYQQKGKHIIPQHGMAMMTSELEAIELEKELALRYLRKETISLPDHSIRGWHLVSFKGVNLGWIKALEGRINNYYPNGLRLRI